MKKSFLLFAILVLLSSSFAALGSESAPKIVRAVAQNWASIYYQGVIDQGTPYYAPDQTISAWVFTVYRKLGLFPSAEEIKALVAKYRGYRLQAEAYLSQCIADNDREGIVEASRLIQEYWAAMRNAETFATIFVTEKPRPHVAMAYPGLPPHYVSIRDAIQKAKETLSTTSVDLVDYYFLGPINIYAKFEGGNECTYVNIVLPGKETLPALESSTGYNNNENETAFSPDQKIAKSMSTVEVIIEGVPDYNSWPTPPGVAPRSCVEVSAAMVLGYWNDQGYVDLVDGPNTPEFPPDGDSGYAG